MGKRCSEGVGRRCREEEENPLAFYMPLYVATLKRAQCKGFSACG